MSNPRYIFAVIVSNHHDWRVWVSNKVYGTGTKNVRSNRFTLRDIEYRKVQDINDVRGNKFHGVIEDDNARYNERYDDIMSTIERCLL